MGPSHLILLPLIFRYFSTRFAHLILEGAMKQTVKKAVAIVVGWAFVVLGIIGLFLPVMQGILFIIIGLTILSSEYVWAHHLLAKLRARFPKIASYSDQAREKASHWLRRAYGPGEAR